MSNKSRGQRAETALRAILQERGYLVIRSAASKVYDLVCVDEGGFVFFLEVKSVKNHCYRVSRTAMTKEQHAQMRRDALCYGSDNVEFVYSVRFPDGEYRFYPFYREIMPQHEGFSLDVAFPVRITPNIPSYKVPVEGDARANGNGGETETARPVSAALLEPRACAPMSTAGLDRIDPDGDTRDAQC